MRLWTVADGQLYATLEGHGWANDREGIRYCHFSPDGARIVSGAFDGTLRVWDVAHATQLYQFEEPGAAHRYPKCAAYSRDGRWIVAGFGTSLHVLEAGSGARLHTYRCSGGVSAVALSPTSDVIAAGESGGAVSLLEPVGFDCGS